MFVSSVVVGGGGGGGGVGAVEISAFGLGHSLTSFSFCVERKDRWP